jgi:hypothetical protein
MAGDGKAAPEENIFWIGLMSNKNASAAPELRLYRWNGASYTLSAGLADATGGGLTLQSYESTANPACLSYTVIN